MTDEMIQCAFKIPKYLYDELKIEAINQNEYIQRFINTAIRERLNRLYKENREVSERTTKTD